MLDSRIILELGPADLEIIRKAFVQVFTNALKELNNEIDSGSMIVLTKTLFYTNQIINEIELALENTA